jgi:hypothetical protein
MKKSAKKAREKTKEAAARRDERSSVESVGTNARHDTTRAI